MDWQPGLPGRCGIEAFAPRQAGPTCQLRNFRCPQLRRIQRPATELSQYRVKNVGYSISWYASGDGRLDGTTVRGKP